MTQSSAFLVLKSQADTESESFHNGTHSFIDTELFHHASTFNHETRVRPCVLQLQDKNLLGKLSTRGLIALVVKHHFQCLRSMYKVAEQTKGCVKKQDIVNHCTASTFCHHIEMKKAVCLLKLKDQQFITVAIDSISQNPSTTTANDSFHGKWGKRAHYHYPLGHLRQMLPAQQKFAVQIIFI